MVHDVREQYREDAVLTSIDDDSIQAPKDLSSFKDPGKRFTQSMMADCMDLWEWRDRFVDSEKIDDITVLGDRMRKREWDLLAAASSEERQWNKSQPNPDPALDRKLRTRVCAAQAMAVVSDPDGPYATPAVADGLIHSVRNGKQAIYDQRAHGEPVSEKDLVHLTTALDYIEKNVRYRKISDGRTTAQMIHWKA